jgi:PAS domain S-box-containing protein
MVVELLRPIRWDNGLGYYFAGRVDSGVLDLFADKPQYEGINFLKISDVNLREVFSQMIHMAKEKGAGKLSYNWTKPEVDGSFYPKISFVKYFEPFDWFIGAGIYIDEMEDRIQKDILEQVEQIRFGQEGDVLVFRLDGTIIGGRNRRIYGRSIKGLVDVEKAQYGHEMLEIAKSGKANGYVEYGAVEKRTGGVSRRLSYIKKYEDWNWVFATSVSMVEMEQAINDETETYKEIAFKNITLFLILFVVAVSILLLLSYVYSMKIKHGIDLFTTFFKRAADSKVRIEKRLLSFKEFEVLGEYANRMVEDRLEKEQLLKRDELRLDTLLKLGMLESYSLQEMYDFTLQRIAEITCSEAGYFAAIENNIPLLKSQVILENGEWQNTAMPETTSLSDPVLVGVVENRKMGVLRDIEDPAETTFFPIKDVIRQRIDVPVFENNKIVAILGVCNKKGTYDDDDYRQVTLLLEGMWLHITRVTNRTEMRRLRQLLKNITDSMPSMLIGIDDEFKIMQWNRLAETKTGVMGAEAEGCLLADILPRIQKYEGEIKKVILSGAEREIRRVPHSIAGEMHYETITIYPLVFEGIQGAVLRLDDVTDSVRMEDVMIQSEKMLSVGGLAAGIAHEINNPLASVIQNLQVVQKRLSADLPVNLSVAEELGVHFADIESYMEKRGVGGMLDTMGRDSRRAAKLVHNMLSFSRKSESVFAVNDLRKLLDKSLTLGLADYDLKENYDFRQICVNKEYAQNVRNVSCEETNIQQVFLNIITNAAHAIAENRENVEVPALILRVQEEEGMVRIEIEDNGPGIDLKTRKRIFEPFFTTKGVGKGTGFGLSISYFIVNDQHHGSIEVRSEPGRGTVFVIRLPFEQED